MVGGRRWLLLLAWIAGLAAGRLAAAEVSAQFDRDVVEVGGTAVLRLTITDAGNVPIPELPPVAGARIAFAGTGQEYRFVNGRQSSSVVHNFAVTPAATGTVTIPPIVVSVNGGQVRTPPLSLQVTQGLDLGRFGFVELLTPTNEVYVGQTFPVRLRFLFRVSPRDVDLPTLNTDGFVVGRRPRPTSGQERIEGQVWGVVTSELALTAARTGELPIGPVEWSASFPLPRRGGRGPFDDPFFQGLFGGAELRRFAFRSATNRVRVVDPPEAGRPEAYAGAVGRFSLNGTASPTEVTVGDPITVRVRVAGEGAIESLSLPEPPASPDFRVYAGTNWFEAGDPLGLTGARNFELVYVPQHPEARLLPLPELPYFDPVKKTYAVASARPLAIRVKPSAKAQAVPTAQPNLPASAAAPAPAPVRALRPLKAVAGSRGWPLPRAWLAALVSLPALLVAGITLGARVRWRRAPDLVRERRRQRRAEVEAGRGRLAGLVAAGDSAGFLAALGGALAGELELLTGVPAATVTAGIVDSHPALAGLEESVRRDLREIFAVLDAARYAPAGSVTGLGRLREQGERLLDALRQRGGGA